MYCVAALYNIKLGHEQQAIKWFRELEIHTRSEVGNVSYLVHQSLTDPYRFLLYEQYTDEAAFDAHCAAPYFEEYVVRGLRTIIEDRQSDRYELLIGNIPPTPLHDISREHSATTDAPKRRSARTKRPLKSTSK